MKFTKIKKIRIKKKETYDITVQNNHNFFCNKHLIGNSDYRGEIMLPLYNYGRESVMFERGERIAQMVISPVTNIKFKEGKVPINTSRGTGGFGSTGR